MNFQNATQPRGVPLLNHNLQPQKLSKAVLVGLYTAAMSFFGGASSSTTAVPASAEKDIEVADPPTDSISSISFSSAADYLAVGSWDNNVSH